MLHPIKILVSPVVSHWRKKGNPVHRDRSDDIPIDNHTIQFKGLNWIPLQSDALPTELGPEGTLRYYFCPFIIRVSSFLPPPKLLNSHIYHQNEAEGHALNGGHGYLLITFDFATRPVSSPLSSC